MRIFVVSLMLVLLPTISWARAPADLDPYEAFQLWTGCEAVDLFVYLQKNDTEIDLTEEEIEIAVRSRLRSARIYNEDTLHPVLLVTVHVVGNAFSIEVAFAKVVSDVDFSDKGGFGTTWKTGSAGTHSNDANRLLTSVSQDIDEFLDEYLRVNADSC